MSNQALSRLSVQIMGSENMSSATQEHLNSAKSVLQSKSITASEATDAALSETTNFLSSVGKAMSSGQDFHKSVSASEAQSLQNFKNYVNDIQQSTGLNEAQAVEAAVGASSGALQLIGIDIKGGFSSSAARSQAVHAAQSIAEQSNYSDNLDKVVSAAQSFSEAHNDTKNAEIGQGATSSLNRAKSLRNEVSVAQNQVDTLSKDISSSHGKSLSINKDLTQPVLDFIAHQPINSGPNGESQGQIGHERARQILENGGTERDAYLNRFQEENPQYSIQSINSAQEKGNLSSQFSSGTANVRGHSNIISQHSQNREQILAQGQAAGLDPNHTPQSIQSELKDFIGKNNDKILEGKTAIDTHEHTLQKSEADSKEKNLAISAGGNFLKSTGLIPDENAYAKFLEKQQALSEGNKRQSNVPSSTNVTATKNTMAKVIENIIPSISTTDASGEQVKHSAQSQQNMPAPQETPRKVVPQKTFFTKAQVPVPISQDDEKGQSDTKPLKIPPSSSNIRK